MPAGYVKLLNRFGNFLFLGIRFGCQYIFFSIYFFLKICNVIILKYIINYKTDYNNYIIFFDNPNYCIAFYFLIL